jgi:hypothetical protein
VVENRAEQFCLANGQPCRSTLDIMPRHCCVRVFPAWRTIVNRSLLLELNAVKSNYIIFTT